MRELAAYEKETDAVEATEGDFERALFPTHGAPAVFCDVAEVAGGADDGHDGGWRVAGMVVWFVTFSTWRGRHGIWLEDLYVRPEHRGHGLGADLLAVLAARCVERGYRRLEWNVLDWNTPALDVYRALGARPLDAWTVHRLDGPALAALAARRTPS